MMLVYVARARHLAQHVLAALCLLGAGRFASASFETWSASRGAVVVDADSSAVTRPPVLDFAAPTSAAGAAPPAPPGDLITVVLSVSHGNRRSEVFLDDSPLGHTVYVGQVPCRRGSDVTVRIQPKRGPAIEHLRRCDGSDIAISEP
jgi:hypothetical protein